MHHIYLLVHTDSSWHKITFRDAGPVQYQLEIDGAFASLTMPPHGVHTVIVQAPTNRKPSGSKSMSFLLPDNLKSG